jgi:hypothetical protein
VTVLLDLGRTDDLFQQAQAVAHEVDDHFIALAVKVEGMVPLTHHDPTISMPAHSDVAEVEVAQEEGILDALRLCPASQSTNQNRESA